MGLPPSLACAARPAEQPYGLMTGPSAHRRGLRAALRGSVLPAAAGAPWQPRSVFSKVGTQGQRVDTPSLWRVRGSRPLV